MADNRQIDAQIDEQFNSLQLIIDENSDQNTAANLANVAINSLTTSLLSSARNDNEIPNQISSAFINEDLLQSNDSSLNYTELSSSIDSSSLNVNQADDVWKMNYNESAIYLEEGFNNDKFDFHPKSRSSLPAYLVVHNKWFYSLDFFASLLLLSLAFFEKPAVDGLRVHEGIHASLELLALSIVGIELFMKYRWMKTQHFIRHTRTAIKSVVLFIMILEALVVLIRCDSHFRVTRALRPVFLIDNHYCGGIRRVVRQILQSLPPFLDMLFLLIFFMLVFAILGFYLFSANPSDPNFSSIGQSFISLFILLTTANFPDVMMPSYSKNRISCLFFVAFLITHLYFLMNIMLAVIYEAFTRIEKDKFRKLLIHRRKACRLAFGLLVTQKLPKKISFKHFEGLMKYYKPSATRLESYLMFKTLDTNRSGFLTPDEFHDVYDVSELKWELKNTGIEWFTAIGNNWMKMFLRVIHRIVNNKWFHIFVYIMIGVSAIYQLIEAMFGNSSKVFSQQIELIRSTPLSLIFVTLYGLETSLKLIGFGLIKYFQSFWNRFDFTITCLAIIGLIFAGTMSLQLSFIFVLRSIRLLKLLENKRRFKDIMGAFIFIIVKRFVNLSIVVLIVYYVFAILGMELFSTYDLKNCCRNTSVGIYFRYDPIDTASNGFYYLNSFSDIIASYVTLFELMVVNNWYILMEAYAYVSTEWSRIYFMTFYIMTLVVITIIVALVLDTFLFRIQCKDKLGDIDKDTHITVEVALTPEELKFCTENAYNVQNISQLLRYSNYFFNSRSSSCDYTGLVYKGIRARTKFSMSLNMYSEEIKNWIQKSDEEERLLLRNYSETTDEPRISSRLSRRTFSCT